jgi:DNA modification methylase
MSAGQGRRRNVHPFPARMAPDLALEKIESLTQPGAVVLDPMCGSGTVPRLAVEEARRAIACDVDPLAVLITRTACKPHWSEALADRAEGVLAAAKAHDDGLPDWLAADAESSTFVEYWFAPRQRAELARIAKVLIDYPDTDDPLRVALSRLIVTKDRGASLARDTSHSRPHKVRDTNDFDVCAEFVASAARVERLVGSTVSAAHQPSIRKVDARSLSFVAKGSVDLIVTSPPYLNAIDYLRGHRLSLVWLGWQLAELRHLRAESIGAERALIDAPGSITTLARSGVPRLDELSPRSQRMVWRFTNDIDRLCRSLARVTRPGGHLVFVVADSQLKGVPVENSALCRLAAEKHGFDLRQEDLRPLPAQHRYLPPPDADRSTLSGRMREEAVLTFQRVA